MNKQKIKNKACQPSQILKSREEIGKGQYGVVYRGCLNKQCKKVVAMKNSKENLSAEYKIAELLANMRVPEPYAHATCKKPKRNVMYSEYVNGKPLKNHIQNDITPVKLRAIVCQVLITLYNIKQKYPSFRHNDLHLGNVLVEKTLDKKVKFRNNIEINTEGVEARINDFGLSKIQGYNNPLINKNNFKRDYGIYPGNHEMYDIHYFLNAIYTEIVKVNGYMKTKEFIRRILPLEYLTNESPVVKNFRLRGDVNHVKLPSFESVFRDPYFRDKKINITQILKPVNQDAAKKKAMAALAAMKKSPVNQNAAKKKAMAVLAAMKNKQLKKPLIKKK